MSGPLLRSIYFVLMAMAICFWPAILVGLFVGLIFPNWDFIAFIAVYSRLLTEFIFHRKRNWLS